jgi:Ca2+-binding RTX toxin-like protein
MRRAVLGQAGTALALVLASGVALAVPRIGDDEPNILVGTNREDSLLGTGGDDLVNGLGGDDKTFGAAEADEMSGGSGDDIVIGGPGSDSIHSDILDFQPSGSCHRGNGVLIGEVARTSSTPTRDTAKPSSVVVAGTGSTPTAAT